MHTYTNRASHVSEVIKQGDKLIAFDIIGGHHFTAYQKTVGP